MFTVQEVLIASRTSIGPSELSISRFNQASATHDQSTFHCDQILGRNSSDFESYIRKLSNLNGVPDLSYSYIKSKDA